MEFAEIANRFDEIEHALESLVTILGDCFEDDRLKTLREDGVRSLFRQ